MILNAKPRPEFNGLDGVTKSLSLVIHFKYCALSHCAVNHYSLC